MDVIFCISGVDKNSTLSCSLRVSPVDLFLRAWAMKKKTYQAVAFAGCLLLLAPTWALGGPAADALVGVFGSDVGVFLLKVLGHLLVYLGLALNGDALLLCVNVTRHCIHQFLITIARILDGANHLVVLLVNARVVENADN